MSEFADAPCRHLSQGLKAKDYQRQDDKGPASEHQCREKKGQKTCGIKRYHSYKRLTRH